MALDSQVLEVLEDAGTALSPGQIEDRLGGISVMPGPTTTPINNALHDLKRQRLVKEVTSGRWTVTESTPPSERGLQPLGSSAEDPTNPYAIFEEHDPAPTTEEDDEMLRQLSTPLGLEMPEEEN